MRGRTEDETPPLNLTLTSEASWIEVLDQDRLGIRLAVPRTFTDLDASLSSSIPLAVHWDRRPCITASHRDVDRREADHTEPRQRRSSEKRRHGANGANTIFDPKESREYDGNRLLTRVSRTSA